MLVLAVDASTSVGTAALIREGALVGETTAAMRGANEERLMPAIVELLRTSDTNVAALTAVACGDGPGSFTSLRIAAAIAKGIAAARGISLYVAPSPLLVVSGAEPRLDAGAYVAALDAMRGDVFALAVRVTRDGEAQPDGDVGLLPRRVAEDRARSLGATVVGPAEDPVRLPHARGFVSLLRHGVARRVDVTAWEPTYGRKAEAQVRWEQTHGRPLEAK